MRCPTDESTPQLDVARIPQTPASHVYTPPKEQGHTIDMKKKDPRDTFHKSESDSFSPIAKVFLSLFSPPERTKLWRPQLCSCSAFDEKHVSTRCPARLLVQAHLPNQRSNSETLPRAAPCMYLLFSSAEWVGKEEGMCFDQQNLVAVLYQDVFV